MIQFRSASPTTLVGVGQKTGAVFQALRYVNKDRVNDLVIEKITRVWIPGTERSARRRCQKDMARAQSVTIKRRIYTAPIQTYFISR